MQDLVTTVLTPSIQFQSYFVFVGGALAGGLLFWFYLPMLFRNERANHGRDPALLIREGLAMALMLVSASLCFGGVPSAFALIGFVVAAVILATSKARLKAWLVFATFLIVAMSWPFVRASLGQ